MKPPRIEDFISDAPSELQRAKRAAGLCGEPLCPLLAVWRLVHLAQLATVRDDSAGAESLRRGFPADGSHVDAVRFERVTVELCCSQHVDAMLAAAERVLDDLHAERIDGAPESHGERRRR